MPKTSLGLTYPASTDHTRMWEHIQTLAADVDALLQGGRVSVRIATQIEDTDSATFTAETEIVRVTASLVAGRTYRVKLVTRIGSSAGGDNATIRVREDTIAGNEMVGDVVPYVITNSTAGNLWIVEHEFTAAVTGAKTLIGTSQRTGGTSLFRREASAPRPTILTVDYVKG